MTADFTCPRCWRRQCPRFYCDNCVKIINWGPFHHRQATQIAAGLEMIRTMTIEDADREIAAEHDAIYAGRLSTDLSDDDRALLQEIGWVEDEHVGAWKYIL